MKLENQVVSLDLAKRLKELDVKQESLFWWKKVKRGDEFFWKLSYGLLGDDIIAEHFSAYTVAELGAMLPSHVKVNSAWMPISFSQRENKGWRVVIRGVYQPCDVKEADARAKMLIYLLENNLIKEKGGV